MDGIFGVLSDMVLRSLLGPNTTSRQHRVVEPVVTILTVVPGSTVFTAKVTNAHEGDVAEFQSSITGGTSELVRVMGAIASTLRIDRLIVGNPVLAGVATLIIFATMALILVGLVVALTCFTRDYVRKTRMARAGMKAMRRIETTVDNPASDIFSVKEGRLCVMGQSLRKKVAEEGGCAVVDDDPEAACMTPVSGPLDFGRAREGVHKLRVQSANLLWGSPEIQEASPHAVVM